MDRAVFWKRIERLRSFLSDKGIDSAWIRSPENRRYLSGFRAKDLFLIESSGSLVIGKDHTILVTDPRYEIEAKDEVPDFDIKILKNDQIKEFCKLLMELNVKTVAFEKDYVSYGIYKKMKCEFKKANYNLELIPMPEILKEMRQVKDPQEIEAIKRSAKMILEIMKELRKQIKPGITERELAFKVHELSYYMGAEDLAFPPIVASGKNSALPHAVPTEKEIRKKEPIIIDIGVQVDGYCSDITRTFFIDGADLEFEKIYSTVETAKNKAIEEAKPGIKACELDKIARDIIEEAGYGRYFSHGLGHGVGLSVHESPSIYKTDSTTLTAGMVITIEPGIYIPGKGGVRIEEMIVIKEDKCEVLTKGQYQ